ncbi:hypothetical protein L249_7386 [Ophiocordyceps polyrhachis-furcata BCC 54312]|uniref:Glycosyltransferase family 25 protein n=1 Tax=Ophiocordyceps polyrhachis-furcata BCC 54312 TaxID=1330021 RepID=A0A367L9G3_9HYPO|nr:hypothetical protein L249_7386 [Ophiocordyceps polyrhachis-furcata BCC 54312]
MKISISYAWPTARCVRLTALALSAVLGLIIISWIGGENFTSSSAFNRSGIREPSRSSMRKPNWEENWERRVMDLSALTDLGRVANRTLGFEKVIAIGLPERSDKRDALDLMAALSGFDLDWVDGVKSSDISKKAIPFGIDLKTVHDNFLGGWRGHMNAIRRVVNSGVSSALIMEDDMDWDVHLKLQLNEIAQGVRQVLGEFSPHLPKSPYGDSWDVLWLGHCGEPFPETLEENVGLEDEAKARMSVKHTIIEDNTVPPYSEVSHLVDWSAFSARTRLVHLSAAPICSFAYAISQSAARKILFALSVDGLQMAFDNSLAQLCRDSIHDLGLQKEDGYRLRCLSVNPTMMFHHRAKGLLLGDSDVQSSGQDGSAREQGISESIKWSMRLNLRNILTGQPLDPQFST